MYTQTEKVNIEPKSYLPVFRISQNDVGRTLKAHLVSDEGTITIPTSATVTMAGIKPSGLGYTVTGTFDGSDVTFETDATMTDEAGQIESEIRIVDGETLIGTTNVVLNVEPNPHPNDVTDGQREPLVNEITALLNQITAQADRVEEYSSKVLNMTVSAHESQEPTVTKTEGEVVNLDFGLPRGAKGERGERGEQGEAGKDGKDGIDGKDGKDGINGVTPDFSIGTVTTLEPNESASVTLTGTEEEPVLNFGIPRGEKGEQGDVSLSDLEKIMVTDTASGAIASFPDGSDLLPAKSLTATIVPRQSGSGTPSPDNVRPISGWESVETSVCGKNLSSYNEYPSITSLWGASIDALVDIINELPVGTYTISNKYRIESVPSNNIVQHGGFYVTAMIDGSQQPVNLYNTATDNAPTVGKVYTESKPLVITEENRGKINHCYYYCDSSVHTGTGRGTYKCYDIQIELGTTATAYEPYQGTTHTTDLGRTVYGGTVDLVSGVLTVTHAMVTLDGSHPIRWEDWRHKDNGTSAWLYSMELFPMAESNDIFADKLPTVIYADIFSGEVGISRVTQNPTYSFGIRVGVDDLTTVTAINAWLSQNPITVVYPLAEPQTYQLTPQQINTLAGVNNVWADSGDVTIEYYADTKLYIDKKLGGN